jgi:hypothetical protein
LAGYWAHCGLCLASDRVAMARGNRQARKHAAMLAERGRRDAARALSLQASARLMEDET